jgi:hypothetical protein
VRSRAPPGAARPLLQSPLLAAPVMPRLPPPPQPPPPSSPALKRGLAAVLVDIYRTDGPRALLRGLLPRMLLQGPASAATFVCFEQVLRLSRKPDEAVV